MSDAFDPIAFASGEQRKATTPGHSAWVEANAGTGKTKVLTDRVTRLLLAGVRPERRAQGLGGGRRVERLHAEESHVHGRLPCERVDRLHRGGELALDRRADAQPVPADGVQVWAAGEDHDGLPRARQLRAEVAAHAARTHHRDALHHHPRRRK